MVYDRIAEETFAKTVFEDPNYEKEGNLVAVRNASIVGFVGAVAREGVAGRDGIGRDHEKDFGYIKALFVLKGRGEGARKCLLAKALEFLKSKGKRMARFGDYTGPYFFPGVDTRYEEDLRFYRENGFVEVDDLEDVAIDLRDFTPTPYQARAKQRVTEMGVVIEAYRPGHLDKMRRFVERVNIPLWFPAGWDREFGKSDHHLVALLAQEVVGWAKFSRSPERWWFGPIAVLGEFRRQGIGTCLLVESMLQMRALGAPDVTAGWATVPFYVRNGWAVSRRYLVLQMDLYRPPIGRKQQQDAPADG